MSLSLSIKPFEQVLAEIATTVAIRRGGANTATQLARAQVAATVGAIVKTASTGDLGAAGAALQALLAAKTNDPGTAQVITDLSNIANTALSAEAGILAATPVVGATVEAVLGNVASGISAVAAAYVVKYSTQQTVTATA